MGHTPTRGLVPRNFKLVGEEGRWLVVGNQETKTVVSFAVDAETEPAPCERAQHSLQARRSIAGPDAIFAWWRGVRMQRAEGGGGVEAGV